MPQRRRPRGGYDLGIVDEPGADVMDGGAGTDTLHGMSGDDVLIGGADADVIRPGAGRETINGAGGNDYVHADGLLADVIAGGGGTDTVDFAAVTGGGIVVDLDGQPDDGRPGQGGNTATDVENIVGTPFRDVLTGNAAANRIDAGNGDDDVVGLAGPDVLNGGFGKDRIDGRDGNLGGGLVNDRLDCGFGYDLFAMDAGDSQSNCEDPL